MLHNKSITSADAAEHQSARPDARGGGGDDALVPQLMDALEQGIIVWTAIGTCAMHNQSVLDVLALDRTQLRRGMPLAPFLAQSAGCGNTETERPDEFCAL